MNKTKALNGRQNVNIKQLAVMLGEFTAKGVPQGSIIVPMVNIEHMGDNYHDGASPAQIPSEPELKALPEAEVTVFTDAEEAIKKIEGKKDYEANTVREGEKGKVVGRINLAHPDILKDMSRELEAKMMDLLDNLPDPKFDHLIKLVVVTCHRRWGWRINFIAKYLGLLPTRVSRWTRAFCGPNPDGVGRRKQEGKK